MMTVPDEWALGRNHADDGEPFAVVAETRSRERFYWYGSVGAHLSNTLAEGVTWATADEAKADALAWVKARLP